MLPIVLVAAALGSLLTHGTGAQRLRMARVSIATMQMRETMRFRLTGCLAGGIGVGLDPANVVDFLRPGAPAAQYLRIGDVVVNIDEVSLLDPVTGQQRKLKDAVDTSLDEHTVVITRPLTPLSKEAAQALKCWSSDASSVVSRTTCWFLFLCASCVCARHFSDASEAVAARRFPNSKLHVISQARSETALDFPQIFGLQKWRRP